MLRTFLACILLIISSAAFAQPGPPPDPDVPITGIELLIGLGGLLGLKKIMGAKKSK